MPLLESVLYSKEIIEIGQIAVAITGIAGGVYAIYRYVVKPLAIGVKQAKEFYDKIDKIFEEFDHSIEGSLKHQLVIMTVKINLVEQFFKTTLDLERMSLFQTDNHGKVTWANRLFLNLVKKNLNEVLGDAWVSIISQEEREYVIKEWERAIEQERGFYLKFHILSGDEKKLVYAKTFPYSLNSGSPIMGYVGVLDGETGQSDYEVYKESMKG
jgi:PAS domain-containing protein